MFKRFASTIALAFITSQACAGSAAAHVDGQLLADEANGKRHRQLAGTVHIHPAGTHVYVANRADGTVREGRDEEMGVSCR